MKYGLGALGVILLVTGAFFFYIPTQLPAAGFLGTSLMYTLQANAPKHLAVVAMGVGAILALLALFMHSKFVSIPNAPYDSFRARLGEKKKKTTK